MIIENNGTLSDKFVAMQSNVDLAIEVGAHEASFSKVMSDHFKIKSIAFEANPVVFKKFKKTIKDNLVSYLNYAISDSDGTVAIKIHADDYAGNNSIKDRVGANIVKTYDVKSYTLDNAIDNLNIEYSNAALWIDCEGASKEVLLGATNTLKKCSSVFIETEDIEYWKDQWLTDDVINFLEGAGFTVSDSEKVYDAQKNLIFVRRQK